MFYSEYFDYEIMTVDLHGMQRDYAKYYLAETVSSAPKYIREIVVIHGYNHGTVLQQMVRKEFKDKRVTRKIVGINQGITSLILTV